MSGIKIRSNIQALRATRLLGDTTQTLSQALERLSSGQRINRASDDAAGLSIATSLSVSRRIFTQGIRNLNDGVSLLNIADGALSQLSGISIRLKELAEQAANGTYGVTQRRAIDVEAQQLSKEYFRIARSTTFNGQGLFFAEFGKLRLQAGYGVDGGIASGLGGAIGTGAFSTSTYVDSGNSNTGNAAVLGDLNHDGLMDLVTATSGGTTEVRLGLGDGTFGAARSYAIGDSQVFDLNLADLNGDGILDLVAVGQNSGAGIASVRLGLGDGTFGAARSYSAASALSKAVALDDLNGDGVRDLVTLELVDGSTSRTSVRLGQGDGTFGTAVSYQALSGTIFQIAGLATGDLNGDGIVDLVAVGASGTGAAMIRLGRGDGSFGSATTILMDAFTASGEVTLGDLNGDGILDLISQGLAGGGATSVTIRLGAGDGTFGVAASYVTASSSLPLGVALGDLNGDGNLDLIETILASSDRGVTMVRLGKGDGTFGSATSQSSSTLSFIDAALGDVNGDGVLDIVASGADTVSGFEAVTTSLSKTVDGISPLLPFTLASRAGALSALNQFEHTLGRLANQRGTIGAFQSRIAVAANTLQASVENYAAAAGRIKDADVASESAQLVRTQILQQAAVAVLGQANQQPALAIRLLRE